MDIDTDRLDELIELIDLPEWQYDGLPVFAVGGAVRDTIIGEEPNDIDLMVAEVTPAEMKERGFTEVDNDDNDTFAVFIDDFAREVAIAREEVSTGDGHTDFRVMPVEASVEASDAVERDLKRRDLTVNAMALDLRWDVLFDPHGGVGSLASGTIRHVSDAFRDDPLRILRAARFAARLDFDVAEETLFEMEEHASGLAELPGERIRMEIEKTFKQAENPRKFFDILEETSVLTWMLPELDALTDIPAGPEQYHEEGSAYEHTMLVLEEMHDLMPNNELALWMALTHDLGKFATPVESLPHHHGHGKEALPIIDKMADDLSMTNRQVKSCKNAARHHMRAKNPDELRTATLFDLWADLGEDRHRFIRLMLADARGRRPAGEYEHIVLEDAFQRATDAVAAVSGSDLIEEGHDPDEMGGEQFGNLLRQRRIEKMREFANE